jgi:hypothetical protein
MRVLALLTFAAICGCGDGQVPPPKTDSESIKASLEEQKRNATSEGASKQ